MDDLTHFRNLLKAHYDFYEFEEPKNLVIELTYDQVLKLGVEIDRIIKQGGSQNE